MLVYYAIMFVGTLLQPVLAIIAIGAGLLARRWWVALLGGAVAAAAGFIYQAPEHDRPAMAIAFGIAGVGLAAFIFGLKRALNSPNAG